MVATATMITTHQQCKMRPTPTPTLHRRRTSYYDTTTTVSSPLPSASVLQQKTFNFHPGHQSGGCQVLLSSNINSINNNSCNSSKGRAWIVEQQQRRTSLTAASILRTPQTKIPQRRQSSTDLDNELRKSRLSAFGEAVRDTSSTAGMELRKWYKHDSSPALVAKPNRRRASSSQCPASSTTTSLRRRRSLMHVGGTGTGMGRQRSLSESFVCFTESVFKTLEKRRNSFSNVMTSTFRKNSSAVKVSTTGFLQLMNDQDWLCLQEQYLDTEVGSVVLLELVGMDHSKFQELLVLAAGQPDMDVADKSKSSAPTLLHLACSQTAPLAVVQRLVSLSPCSVYDVNAKRGNGQNVLHVAAHRGCSSRVLDLLIHLAPELAAQKDDQGRFPLHYLCMPMPQEQKPELALSLLGSSVSISNIHLDNSNGTRLPRDFTSTTHRMLTLKMVNQFCHAHPKAITTTDHHTGMSPLMYAVTHGAHADVIDRMMKQPQV
jgi:hypothetical protein